MINLLKKLTIKGKLVTLRPFTMEDLPFIEECLIDPEVNKFTGGTEDDFDKEVVKNWYATRNEQEDRLDLAIIDNRTNNPVGEVVLNLYNEELNSMNFRIMIGPTGRNRGFGTEATELLLHFIFEQTKLAQLTLSVFAFNPRAIHVYEKIGFKLESIDKNELQYEGKWIDSINMVLTKESWLQRMSGSADLL
ncbi:Spermidine N(1)-acetyltransferase [Bacillus sp. THAF10]|uniref:GNAT family N-acetyltransferase n=1 Tax=Bacillus sp. THAF10 TaxID=2587848 RepID=UPI0012686231|nr:GNAT family protein [Bacillus sp. THAF10]QFT87553.1 Spermidine N(1)-acetyltransferase [Bacillus sp. THAF10]